MKDKQKKMRKFHFHSPRTETNDSRSSSGPGVVSAGAGLRSSSPSVSAAPPPPLDLTRVISGSPCKKLQGSGTSTPPYTAPTNLSVDTAVDAILKKQQIYRTSSIGSRSGSLKRNSLKYRAGSTIDESPTNVGAIPPAGLQTASPATVAGGVQGGGFFHHHHLAGCDSTGATGGVQSPFGVFSALHYSASGPTPSEFMHSRVSPRHSTHSTCSALSFAGIIQPKSSVGPTNCAAIGTVPPTPSNSTTNAPFPFYPKSKFKMAHESFRIRMFQEQYGFEPVFMTKKRTADSKFSEFKGGDLNKYTARSYTIKNGNEVFGGQFKFQIRNSKM